jgi:hypothetical protein
MKKVENSRNILLLALDFFLLSGFILVNQVKETGIAFHEWFGMLLGLALLFHLVLHWNWVKRMLARFFKVKNLAQYTKFIVDVLILAGFMIIVISGILMSKSFLPAFGLNGIHSFTLKILHTTSTNVTILLTAAHLMLNVKWMIRVIGRIFKRPEVNAIGSSLKSEKTSI